jgi:hypothetical protein
MIKIPEGMRSALIAREEYGMGFQIGSIEFSSIQRVRGIILNASVFCPIDEFTRLSNILVEYQYALRSSNKTDIQKIYLESRDLSRIKKINRIAAFSESQIDFAKPHMALEIKNASGPAKDAKETYTAGAEVFKRFSAYENDFRVTDKHGLTAGTFGTTEEDSRNIKNGMDAVARYALESKMSANNVFTIKPPAKTKLKQGIVEPAYGEPGGGVEVIFVDGSPDNTVTGPVKIPER